MPTNLPLDFSKSPLERFIEVANSPIVQNLLDEQRTTVLSRTIYSHSVDEGYPDAEIIVEHDRIGDGLPATVPEPFEPIQQKTVEYRRVELDATKQNDPYAITLTVEDAEDVTIPLLLNTLGEQHGIWIDASEIVEPISLEEGEATYTIRQDALAYYGSILIELSIVIDD